MQVIPRGIPRNGNHSCRPDINGARSPSHHRRGLDRRHHIHADLVGEEVAAAVRDFRSPD